MVHSALCIVHCALCIVHFELTALLAPVRSTFFRAVSRVFAVLLLVWTTADLGGGLCVHDREPIAAAVGGSQTARAAASSAGASSGEVPGPGDDCFCCSHFVHPQVRYQVVPVYAFVAAVEAAAPLHPQFPASQLYHPPLWA